ncbi:hypothetical protein O0882_15735 [Janthinobacterium sp. SUN073]|uniref:hypothetical protein n=1 Tax=Janthinobacterium sp. SUN073 TaxID=3004102 RepID=UPI0025B26B57|nr:hypothetical protein [Janthinobacterium sp. SUN073]MDN2697771.1 hypothetical protein [Janthinobacterium sp. SUN073]
MNEAELVSYCRRKGLLVEQLERWRSEVHTALSAGLNRTVGQFDIFDFLAANAHFADGVEAQPFPALAALVDGDFFQIPLECVAAAFPDDDATVGAAPDFGFAFRRPGHSLGLGAECFRFACASDGDLCPPGANPLPE